MKIKTSELEGATLDWAVAKCEEEENEEIIVVVTQSGRVHVIIEPETCYHCRPSTDWIQGGPLIEEYQVSAACDPAMDEPWEAEIRQLPSGFATGRTLLIAAMRAIVASELGDEVDVPDELLP